MVKKSLVALLRRRRPFTAAGFEALGDNLVQLQLDLRYDGLALVQHRDQERVLVEHPLPVRAVEPEVPQHTARLRIENGAAEEQDRVRAVAKADEFQAVALKPRA